MVVAILVLMFRKLKSAAMPIAMNRRAAISTTCHPSPDDIGALEKPVIRAQADMEMLELSTFLGPGLPEIDKMPPLHFHIKRRRWAES
ncbi:uncharacterized protein N7498_010942 [Penicillium cinerascens]|uniref:Uncharacterized protein n=1 Tax=Penicillium cinerascens TaxID=70096 RepID=A0A9W9J8M0_9EURO|nr:uncharacterized protein N7498_010942 [Penicillium cinerascens]KAJ5191957.1 hypothetical protein N7498_010942 [Penicillium cinerascens]